MKLVLYVEKLRLQRTGTSCEVEGVVQKCKELLEIFKAAQTL
jgi:hypothetical protein